MKKISNLIAYIMIILCSTGSVHAQSYLGTWKNSKAEFELKKDGTTVLGGFPATYTYKNGMMTFDFGAGVVLTYKVTVTGNTMTSVGNGQNETYQRVAGKSTTISAGSTPKSNTGGKEIAGNWCKPFKNSTNNSYYSETCMYFDPNGNYTYTSSSSSSGSYGSTAGQGNDSGTWSFDGTTLYINSRTNGAVKYNCTKTYYNKDAALNIDGTVFVTGDNRGGW